MSKFFETLNVFDSVWEALKSFSTTSFVSTLDDYPAAFMAQINHWGKEKISIALVRMPRNDFFWSTVYLEDSYLSTMFSMYWHCECPWKTYEHLRRLNQQNVFNTSQRIKALLVLLSRSATSWFMCYISWTEPVEHRPNTSVQAAHKG